MTLKRAYTLVEIIAVATCLTVLAGVLVPRIVDLYNDSTPKLMAIGFENVNDLCQQAGQEGKDFTGVISTDITSVLNKLAEDGLITPGRATMFLNQVAGSSYTSKLATDWFGVQFTFVSCPTISTNDIQQQADSYTNSATSQ